MRHVLTRGMTLIELLVVISILIVLMGLVAAATGGVRERARQVKCMSNLRQIGIAVSLYRQDYGGSDSPGWPDQMGLPRGPGIYRRPRPGGGRYVRTGDDLCKCANAQSAHRQGQRLGCDYNWVPWGWGTHRNPDPPIPGATSDMPSFPEAAARRGDDLPLLVDENHVVQRLDRAPGPEQVLILRLDGRVSSRRVLRPGGPSAWTW